jgi:hypothetical protein
MSFNFKTGDVVYLRPYTTGFKGRVRGQILKIYESENCISYLDVDDQIFGVVEFERVLEAVDARAAKRLTDPNRNIRKEVIDKGK